jgi:hypothetical protein
MRCEKAPRLPLVSSLLVALVGCAGRAPLPAPPPAPVTTPAPAPEPPRFENELTFLAKYGPVDVLQAPSGGLVAVSGRWQGRVMTSAVEPHGASLGFIHHAFIESRMTGTPFDNYGGEDRFWLGPEGGQFGLYFPPGAPFTIGSWQTPHAMQESEWRVTAHDDFSVEYAQKMHVVNWSRAEFDVAVARTVRVLTADEVRVRLGEAPPAGTKWVAFESINRITNAGARAWSRDSGLLSIWILGMYAPAPDARILVPFDPDGTGPVVNDAYFGAIPAERLAVHAREGWLSLVADGERRGKIGLSASRARDRAGSYSASARLLTIVRYGKPKAPPASGAEYVNSMWEQQARPFGGDVVNAYNDGPTEPGKPSLGGFYELETSSPAAALAPGASIEHVQTTLHVVGDPGSAASLAAFARQVLGVPIE